MLRKTLLCTLMTVAMFSFSGVFHTGDTFDTDIAYAQTSPPNIGSGLQNPLKSEYDTIPKFLLAVVEVILIFAVPIIVFFIIYGGFLLVTARGDAAQIAKAKTTLMWAVVGGVIVLGASALVQVIQATVDAFKT